jgi:hypothetical protein
MLIAMVALFASRPPFVCARAAELFILLSIPPPAAVGPLEQEATTALGVVLVGIVEAGHAGGGIFGFFGGGLGAPVGGGGGVPDGGRGEVMVPDGVGGGGGVPHGGRGFFLPGTGGGLGGAGVVPFPAGEFGGACIFPLLGG